MRQEDATAAVPVETELVERLAGALSVLDHVDVCLVEAADRLKEITGKGVPSTAIPEGMAAEAAQEVEAVEVAPAPRPEAVADGPPPTPALLRGDYSTGYPSYDASAPPPEPAPALPRVRRRRG